MSNPLPKPYKKVQKGYLIDNLNPFAPPTIRYILVDKHTVFIPTYSWVSRSFIEETYKLVVFPGYIDYHDWWDGWWTSNWYLADWTWCYGKKRLPDFMPCRIVDNDDGSQSIFAA